MPETGIYPMVAYAEDGLIYPWLVMSETDIYTHGCICRKRAAINMAAYARNWHIYERLHMPETGIDNQS